jgi:hypothetical protein
MATRMQQRRGTASQWTSANPVLNAGEMGWESDTNKFKIGDGTNHWADLDYFSDINSTVNPAFGSSITFEGATANDFETTLSITDPTADRTITFPDLTGTVQLRVTDVSDTEIGYLNGVTSAIQTQIDLKAPLANPTFTGTVAGVTATHVGLGNVDNTSDANKPVSTATQTALDLKANLSAPTFTGTVSAASLTLSGDLTVNGTTTTINSTTLSVDDKNIVIGDVETPTDTTADGGGITLKGATDKTINWVDATDAWTSSEDFNLVTGKSYEIAGTSVLSGSTLGSGITASSLTSVGTITSGTWNGTTIAVANGGTGITSFGSGIADFLGTPSSANLISAITDETGSGSLVFATAPTITNAVAVNPILRAPEERLTVSATAATGTIPFDILTSGILYYTSNASANWTLNVRGSSGATLNDSLATNDSITVVFFVTNGVTPYYQTGFQIDGSAVTPKWQNGTAPSAGNASSIDIYSYTIVKTGDAAFTAFGSQTKFA